MRSRERIVKEGEIYITRFHPSAGTELKRFRPAIVLKDSKRCVNQRLVPIVPLSTRPSTKGKRYEIELNIGNGLNNLKKKSYALSWYVGTIDINRFSSKMGEITKTELKEIKTSIKNYLE